MTACVNQSLLAGRFFGSFSSFSVLLACFSSETHNPPKARATRKRRVFFFSPIFYFFYGHPFPFPPFFNSHFISFPPWQARLAHAAKEAAQRTAACDIARCTLGLPKPYAKP